MRALVVFVLMLGLIEIGLRALPSGTLPSQVERTPPLVPQDQINVVYKKNWFRGKRPCEDCPSNTVRVMSIGGSSTYGVPMRSPSRTFSAELQRILDERRPGENYEVLNAGIAGFGMTQVLAALREELLVHSPNIVIVCEWFNDSQAANRWYPLKQLSDREAYERLRVLKKLAELPVYKQFRETRLFALNRYLVLKLKEQFGSKSNKTKASSNPRLSPEEYRASLEELIELGYENNFVPVFVLEALNRSKSFEVVKETNPYVAAMLEVAAREGVSVVNPLDEFHRRRGEWLFYDFIHPNVEGHRIIAESIYQTLYQATPARRIKTFWKERSIDFSQPMAVGTMRRQISSEELQERGLVFRARVPNLQDGHALLEVYEGVNRIKQFSGLEPVFQRFKLPPTLFSTDDPLFDLSLRARVLPPRTEDWQMGKTEYFSPAVIEALSGGKEFGWTTLIRVNGRRWDYDHRGYNVVVIGGKSGQVLSTNRFDFLASKAANKRFQSYFSKLDEFREEDQPPVVVVTVKTDGHHNVDPQIVSPLLQSVGATGDIPSPFESYLLIGVPGAKPGTAFEETGKRLIKKELGDKAFIGADLLEVRWE